MQRMTEVPYSVVDIIQPIDRFVIARTAIISMAAEITEEGEKA